ncbi:MAG: hypothetical protein OEQ81_07670 [Flavobacteriaceae bacterium]|nr:hypothetical protein [Flavobacteriaceae bacterium]
MKYSNTCGLLILLCSAYCYGQTRSDSLTFDPQQQLNAAQRLLSGNYASTVTVGAYGEILYNQPEGDNGELDVQRLVLLFGYSFDDRTQFVSEIEIEHVNELFVEQAFVNYNLATNINLRGGLMLVPMGIVNEFHEPTTFNGVERPAMDNAIIPTTWREIGLGISGRLNNLSLGYQAYVFNGFKSTETDGSGGVNGLLKGSNGLRGGRQKAIQSTIDNPNVSIKFDYYGIAGTRLGLAGYFGRSQADDEIDSLEGSTIGIQMIGLDGRYAYKRFTARGQLIWANLKDTEAYNNLTGMDLGSVLRGFYIEGAYNLLPVENRQKLFAFVRYEQFNTHADTEGSLMANNAYDREDITSGLTYHIAPGVVIKGDYQIRSNDQDTSEVSNRLNFGIGVWF